MSAKNWLKPLRWLEKLIGVVKLVERPMTFYTLVVIFSFYLIYTLIPGDDGAMSIGTALAILSITLLDGVICVCVYLWGKAKLAADPGAFSDSTSSST